MKDISEDVKSDNKEKICSELRRKRKQENKNYELLCDSYSMSLIDILNHVFGDCNCNCSEIAVKSKNDEPWREKFVIEQLYLEHDMRFTKMADIMKCHSETAKKYVDEYNVSPIDSSDRTSSRRVNRLLRKGADEEVEIKEDKK